MKRGIASRAINRAGFEVLAVGAGQDDGGVIGEQAAPVRQKHERLLIGYVLDDLKAKQRIESTVVLWPDDAEKLRVGVEPARNYACPTLRRLVRRRLDPALHQRLGQMSAAAAEIDRTRVGGHKTFDKRQQVRRCAARETHLLQDRQLGQSVPEAFDQLGGPF
jgi:hypothetical protein